MFPSAFITDSIQGAENQSIYLRVCVLHVGVLIIGGPESIALLIVSARFRNMERWVDLIIEI